MKNSEVLTTISQVNDKEITTILINPHVYNAIICICFAVIILIGLHLIQSRKK